MADRIGFGKRLLVWSKLVQVARPEKRRESQMATTGKITAMMLLPNTEKGSRQVVPASR
jgi:hypothetical protein